MKDNALIYFSSETSDEQALASASNNSAELRT
jgi:hypothetical protein